MSVHYDILVQGNNLRLADDFLGISTVVLVHTDIGPMLFDTGGYISRMGLLKALRKRDLNPCDIKIVFLSHLHFDHAHNIDLFPSAKFLVSKREWDYAANPNKDDYLIPWGVQEQLSKCNFELICGEGEITKGIEYFPTPGHTPGCYSLTFESAEKGRVVLAGDAVKYVKEVILQQCDLAFDTREAGTASIKRILSIADTIVPGHFPELTRQESGLFSWSDEVSFDLRVR